MNWSKVAAVMWAVLGIVLFWVALPVALVFSGWGSLESFCVFFGVHALTGLMIGYLWAGVVLCNKAFRSK